MITTADWLRYIESLGPTDDAESLRMRLESAGADPPLASFLMSVERHRRIARHVARVALMVVVAGVGWSAYQWSLALRGAANAPDMNATIIPAAMIAAGALAMLIASGIELSPPLDLIHHLIPSELTPPPRQVGVTLRTSAARRMAVSALFFMLAPLALAAPQVRDRVWLIEHGVETTGRVISMYTRKGSKGSIDYYCMYAFDRGTGVQSLRRSQYQRIQVGDTVPVTYLPSRPEINRAMTRAQLRSVWAGADPVMIVAMVYIFIFVPLVALAAGHGVIMQRRLGERGIATMAVITRVRGQMIEYRFDDRTGRYMYGKRRLRERPVEGQPLVVLYDPEKPKRSVPLGALSDLELR